MAVRAPGTPGLVNVFAWSLSAVRADLAFFGGIFAVYTAITYGLEMGYRALANPEASNAVQGALAAAELVLNVLLITVMRSIVYQRQTRGEPGTSPAPDLQAGLMIAPQMAVLYGLLSAASIFPISTFFLPAEANMTAGPALSFAAAILGLVLYLNFALAPPALVDRQRGIIDAISRGRKAINGHRWTIFGIAIVVGLATAVLSLPVTFAKIARGVTNAAEIASAMNPVELAYLSAVQSINAIIGMLVFYAFYHGVNRTNSIPREAAVFS